MSRSRRETSVASVPALSRAPRYEDVLAGIALVAAAAVSFHGALGYFFTQDDFEGLSRARGILPRLPGPWRILSNQWYFDAMRAIADLRPLPYHLASLVLHQFATVLAYLYLRGWLSVPAALAGAAFFAVHPALFTALYWISAGSTIHSAVFALLALLAERTSGRRRWLAVPLYALALCARETAIGLPGVMLATQLHDRRARPNDPVMWGLAVVATAFVLGLLTFDVIGLTGGHGASSPYGIGFGPHVLVNLSTYLAWSMNFLLPTVRSFSDAADPGSTLLAAVVAAVTLGGCAIRSLRVRGWIVAWAAFALWIAPMLPLRNHTYHYYLYGPLIGIAWGLGIILDVVFERTSRHAAGASASGAPANRAPASIRESPAAMAIAVALAVFLTWNGRALVHKIESYPFDEELRADPTVDRATIAGNVHRSLAAVTLPAGIRLHFWSPVAIARQQQTHPGAEQQESYWEKNVRTALLDGLGVRVLFPQVREVQFVRTLTAVGDSTWYAVYRPDGNLGLASYAMLDSLTRAHSGISAR